MFHRFHDFAHRMPWFPVFYLYSTWSGQVTVYAFAGTDGFFFGFTLYMAFLLQALRYDIQDALKPIRGGWSIMHMANIKFGCILSK